jgi:F0F1-type ATP synthase delta subunit
MKLEDNVEIKGSMAFKYLGAIFTNSGKCKEEMLNRNEQARKATITLNNLLWSKHISLNTKKKIFFTVVKSILSYSCELWTVDYRLKKKQLSTGMDFWRTAARTSTILRVRNEVIRDKWE